MTILDNTNESELTQLLSTTIQQLSEQLAQNRSLSSTLHNSIGNVKVERLSTDRLEAVEQRLQTQAAHSKTGFVLRRFNLDKPQDIYDAELERMNTFLAVENQSLLHDNKQLGVLIKEYEQTLESVMGAFRTRARDVQEHELALIREYEARVLARESENLLRALSSTTAESISLGRISATLRSLLRVLNGEDVPSPGSQSVAPEANSSPLDEFDFGPREDDDWALERECELSRLERENVVLRRLLGHEVAEPEHMGGVDQAEQQRASSVPRPNEGTVAKKMLGGAPGTVGPYGTYKRGAGRAG